MPQPGTLIEGKYEILEKIHEGGMGTIYKVRHRLLDEVRVVKVMKPSITTDEELKRRFVEEAKTATRLKHPNIATIHDFALDEDGTAYLVMEYIDGVNLAELRQSKGPPGVPLTLEIAHQALLALGYLHRRNVIHRDVAPDNLMLTQDEEGNPRVKLIDLGIAKALDRPVDLTSTGVFLGKLKYASPEQYGSLAAGEKLDGRSDLYGLSVVVYELLTDRRPFVGERPAELLRAHLTSPPLPFEQTDPQGKVPPEVRRIVLKGLEKSREDRFASAEEFDREIVALRQRLGDVASIDPTVQVLSGIRETPGGAEAQTITPSAQNRLDRQFVAAQTPSQSRSELSVVPKGAETAPIPVRYPRVIRRVVWIPAIGLALAVLIFLVKRSPESSRSVLPTPLPTAPIARSNPEPRSGGSEERPTAVQPTTLPPPTAVPTAVPTLQPSEVSRELVADRTAADRARQRAARAQASAQRAGAEDKEPTLFQRGHQAQLLGNRLLSQQKFSDAAAAFERSAESFSKAETAALERKTERTSAAMPPPVPTSRPEPTRFVLAPTAPPEPAPTAAREEPRRASEQDRIRETLKEYQRAFNTLDVNLYARVFPSFVARQRQSLDRAWHELKSQRLDLEIAQIEVKGSQAVVRGRQTLAAVPQIGGEQRDSREISFRLEKRGETWVITDRN